MIVKWAAPATVEEADDLGMDWIIDEVTGVLVMPAHTDAETQVDAMWYCHLRGEVVRDCFTEAEAIAWAKEAE